MNKKNCRIITHSSKAMKNKLNFEKMYQPHKNYFGSNSYIGVSVHTQKRKLKKSLE